MSSAGPRYPGAAISLANAGTSENANAWGTPTNVGADDDIRSEITAPTFDSPDISEILVASSFGFTIPANSAINGITVEIQKIGFTSANSGVDFRVQLATGTTFADLVGSNKATADVWPSSLTTITYGGSADTWSAGLTTAQVNASGFAVFLSAYANVANADIGVDFIRVTITYTEPVSATATVATATGAAAGVTTLGANAVASAATATGAAQAAVGRPGERAPATEATATGTANNATVSTTAGMVNFTATDAATCVAAAASGHGNISAGLGYATGRSS